MTFFFYSPNLVMCIYRYLFMGKEEFTVNLISGLTVVLSELLPELNKHESNQATASLGVF